MVNDLLFDSNSSEETDELVCESETPSFPANDLSQPESESYPRGIGTVQTDSASPTFTAMTTELP